jgi:hypothetical protein
MPQRSTFAAPDKEDEGSVSYCPRCHVQFKRAGVMCHICNEVEVVPFTPRKTAEPVTKFLMS